MDTQYRPLIAIVGSARVKVVNNQENEKAAIEAAIQFGEKLAITGWRIAVYTSLEKFIEKYVVEGYISAKKPENNSIVCYYPHSKNSEFSQFVDKIDKEVFDFKPDPSDDWEVSFYRSLTLVDAIFLLGGGPSTLIAGQIAISRNLPILSISRFSGASLKVWKLLPRKDPNAFYDQKDIDTMARWDKTATVDWILVLNNQYQKYCKSISDKSEKIRTLKAKANCWDQHEEGKKERLFNSRLALTFLVAFVMFLAGGMVLPLNGNWYSSLAILGLCVAGGLGATIRIISPGAPHTNKGIAPLVGTVMGLIFSLLYLMPQLLGEKSFLVPSQGEISAVERIQFLSAMIVAFMAGLGFDYALEQLLKKAKDRSGGISPVPVVGVETRAKK